VNVGRNGANVLIIAIIIIIILQDVSVIFMNVNRDSKILVCVI
jgi:hypothetical protein